MFTVTHNSTETQWTEDTLKSKLEAIGNLEGKKVAWIKSDLSISKSNIITRLFWTLVAKHFSWMRSYFYGVELDKTSDILNQLTDQVWRGTNTELIKLLFKVIVKFSEIAPNHTHTSWNNVLTSIDSVFFTKTEALSFVKWHGEEVKCLDLSWFESLQDSEIIQFIENCPNVETLKMNSHQDGISDEILHKLTVLTKLKLLDLSSCYLGRNFNALSELTSLEILRLKSNPFIDFEALASLPNLQNLWIKDSSLLSHDHIQTLERIRNGVEPEEPYIYL